MRPYVSTTWLGNEWDDIFSYFSVKSHSAICLFNLQWSLIAQRSIASFKLYQMVIVFNNIQVLPTACSKHNTKNQSRNWMHVLMLNTEILSGFFHTDLILILHIFLSKNLSKNSCFELQMIRNIHVTYEMNIILFNGQRMSQN